MQFIAESPFIDPRGYTRSRTLIVELDPATPQFVDRTYQATIEDGTVTRVTATAILSDSEEVALIRKLMTPDDLLEATPQPVGLEMDVKDEITGPLQLLFAGLAVLPGIEALHISASTPGFLGRMIHIRLQFTDFVEDWTGVDLHCRLVLTTCLKTVTA